MKTFFYARHVQSPSLLLLSPEMRNRSLKSELTNIETLHLVSMNDQLPGGLETGFCGLRLPKRQVKRAIHLFQFAIAFYKPSSYHGANYTLVP